MVAVLLRMTLMLLVSFYRLPCPERALACDTDTPESTRIARNDVGSSHQNSLEYSGKQQGR